MAPDSEPHTASLQTAFAESPPNCETASRLRSLLAEFFSAASRAQKLSHARRTSSTFPATSPTPAVQRRGRYALPTGVADAKVAPRVAPRAIPHRSEAQESPAERGSLARARRDS